MTIRNKLLLFITVALLVTFSLIFWINRMTVKKEIQEITKVNLQSIAYAALSFIDINKDMDKSALDNVINKKITIGKTGNIVESDSELLVIKKPIIRSIINDSLFSSFRAYIFSANSVSCFCQISIVFNPFHLSVGKVFSCIL